MLILLTENVQNQTLILSGSWKILNSNISSFAGKYFFLVIDCWDEGYHTGCDVVVFGDVREGGWQVAQTARNPP